VSQPGVPRRRFGPPVGRWLHDSFPNRCHPSPRAPLRYCDRIVGCRQANLRAAVRHFQGSLEVYTRAAFPVQWAEATASLAAAHGELGKVLAASNAATASTGVDDESGLHLAAAVAQYDLALGVYVRGKWPKEWATVQANLATSHQTQVSPWCEQPLRAAVASSRAVGAASKPHLAALTSPHGVPWPLGARCQNVFWGRQASILAARAVAGGEKKAPAAASAALEAAVEHYELALEVLTLESDPERWAMVQNQLAVCFAEPYKKGDRGKNLELSVGLPPPPPPCNAPPCISAFSGAL